MTDQWTPTKVGELFMLVMPNGRKIAMRITDIDGTTWNATTLTIDEVIQLTPDTPHFNYDYKGPSEP